MSRKNPKNRGGYKPVECQDIYTPENNSQQIERTVAFTANPYTIVGNCKKSVSGRSLSLKLNLDGKEHYLTILKAHIDAIFEDRLGLAHVRKYENENTDVKNNMED